MTSLLRRPGFPRGLLAALTLACLSAVPVLASADQTRPPADMVWRDNITDRREKQRMKQFDVGPYADAQSRLETEIRADLPLDKVDAAAALLDRAADDQALAEATFGKGTRLVKSDKPPRKVWDIDLDTTDGVLYKANATLRIRIENGTAQLNYKPPGGTYFVNLQKIGVETGVRLNASKTGKIPAKTLAFLRNSLLRDNPLREMAKQFPQIDVRPLEALARSTARLTTGDATARTQRGDLDIADFFFGAVQLRQVRRIYEIQEKQGDSYVRMSELSVDRVIAREDGNLKNQVEFGKVELEGDHVSAGALNATQLAAIANSTWRGPHRLADAYDPRFASSPDVVKINGYASALMGYLAPVGAKPTKDSKYVTARSRLAAKGATFTKGRLMIDGLFRTRPRNGGAVRVSRNSLRKNAQAALQAKRSTRR